MPAIIQIGSTGLRTIPQPGDYNVAQAAAGWQGHLDAGRLTAASGAGTTPEIAANRARTERIVRAHAGAVRTAMDTTGFWER